MKRRFGRVVLGGTFDRLHTGHAALLGTAFAAGRRVSIGVTTDAYLREHPKTLGTTIRPYALRIRSLKAYLRRRFPRRDWEVVPIDDRYGRAVGPGIDALVVSAETRAGGEAVNAERRRRGRGRLPLVEAPTALAEDLEPVSSTRIRAGIIDRRGRRLTPITVAIAVSDPGDLPRVTRAIRSVFPDCRFERTRAPPRSDGRPTEAGRWRRRARPRAAELAVTVVRTPDGARLAVAASRHVELDPVRVAAGELLRGVRELLRPPRRKAL